MRYAKSNRCIFGCYLTDEIAFDERSWRKEVYGRGRNYWSVECISQGDFLVCMILFFFLLMTPEKKNLFLKIYFLVGAVAWLIGTLIWYGWLLSNTFQKVFISNEEYIAGQMYYELQNCEQPVYGSKPDWTATETKKSPEEITKCKDAATQRISQQRAYTLKSEMISWSVWWTLFFIVFLTHLPRLRRQYKDTEQTV